MWNFLSGTAPVSTGAARACSRRLLAPDLPQRGAASEAALPPRAEEGRWFGAMPPEPAAAAPQRRGPSSKSWAPPRLPGTRPAARRAPAAPLQPAWQPPPALQGPAVGGSQWRREHPVKKWESSACRDRQEQRTSEAALKEDLFAVMALLSWTQPSQQALEMTKP